MANNNDKTKTKVVTRIVPVSVMANTAPGSQVPVPADAVLLKGDQTINGIKTFNTAPRAGVNAIQPTRDDEFVSKRYIDTMITQAQNASTGFDYKGDTEPAPLTVDDLNKVWLDTATGSIKHVVEDLDSPGNYKFESIAPLSADAVVLTSGDQDVGGVKTFNDTPKLGDNTSTAVVENEDVTNKAYVDESIATAINDFATGGTLPGGGGQSSIAYTNKVNTFTARNVFDKQIEINENPAQDNNAVTLSYMNVKLEPIQNDIEQLKNTQAGTNFVTLDTAQTITGLKTYDVTPRATNKPTNDTDLANKAYVDEAVANAGGGGGQTPSGDVEALKKQVEQLATNLETVENTANTANTTATNANNLATQVETKANQNETDITALENRVDALEQNQGGGGQTPPVDLTNYVTIDTAQTLTGLKTFAELPVSTSTPNNNNQLVTKAFTDDTYVKRTDYQQAIVYKGLKDSAAAVEAVPTKNIGDLYIVKNHTTPTENGIYIYNGASFDVDTSGSLINEDMIKGLMPINFKDDGSITYTAAEYTALGAAEKTNGKLYFIVD